jgi:hypothetical protein
MDALFDPTYPLVRSDSRKAFSTPELSAGRRSTQPIAAHDPLYSADFPPRSYAHRSTIRRKCPRTYCDGERGPGGVELTTAEHSFRLRDERQTTKTGSRDLGLANLNFWVSPGTARFKWGRSHQLPWCIISRSSLRNPRRWTICLGPLLGFQRKPGPGPSHVDQDVSHPRVRRKLRHLLTFGGAVPASFGSKRGTPRDGAPITTPKKKTPLQHRGGSAGFQCLADRGLGASAKLA